MTLVSLVQSVPCVYYRASIRDEGESTGGLTEERAIGFRVRDATGSIRVFPRGARFDVPDRFDRSTDIMGDDPSGLALRRTASTAPVIADSAKARDAAIASLLTVHQPADWTDLPGPRRCPSPAPLPRGAAGARRRGHRHRRCGPLLRPVRSGLGRPHDRRRRARRPRGRGRCRGCPRGREAGLRCGRGLG